MIKEHEEDDLKKNNIDPELVLSEPIKKPKERYKMTDLEEKKEDRTVLSGIKASNLIHGSVVKASKHCPKLF